MKIINKIKSFFEIKHNFWYLIVLLFFVLEIINYSFLSMVAPGWVCSVISISLVVFLFLYVGVMYSYYVNQYKYYINERETSLSNKIEVLENNIQEISEKHIKIENELSDLINEKLNSESAEIIEYLQNQINFANKTINENIDEFKINTVSIINSKTDDILKKTDINYLEQKELIQSFKARNEELIENSNNNTKGLSVEILNRMDKLSVDTFSKLDVMNNNISEKYECITNQVSEYSNQDNIHYENIDKLIKNVNDNIELNTNSTIKMLTESIDTLSFASNEMFEQQIDKLNEINKLSDDKHKELKTIIDEFNVSENEHSNHISDSIYALQGFIHENSVSQNSLVQNNREILVDCLAEVKEGIIDTINNSSAEELNVSEKISDAIVDLTDIIKADGEYFKEKTNEDLCQLVEVINETSKLSLENHILEIKKIDNLHNAVDTNNAENINHIEGSVLKLEALITEENKEGKLAQLQMFVAHEKQVNEKIAEIISVEENVQNSLKNISQQIEKSSDKREKFETDNLNLLEDIIKHNSQNTNYIIEMLSVKTSGLQYVFTEQINQVLDGIDNTDDNCCNAYDKIFNQVIGVSNSSKRKLETLFDELEILKKLVEKQIDAYSICSNDTFEQTSGIKKDLKEGLLYYDTQCKELKSQIYNLQNQVISLNSLSELLKYISESSTRTKFESARYDGVEEIRDNETGNIIKNHYKNDIVILSEMFSKGKKIYEVLYDDSGKIDKTKNFDTLGDIITELHFYKNGQVKTRIEKININNSIQTVISQFDENGNKMI